MKVNDDLAIAEGCWFDEPAAERAVRFIETYCIPSKVKPAKPIKLLDWQKRVIRYIFGWKRPNGRFRFSRVLISCGKKQGKTLLQSAIITYCLYGDIFANPHCVSASVTRKNASQIYDEILYSITKNQKLKKISKWLKSIKEITVPSKEAKYESLSSEGHSNEGGNFTVVVVDEGHAHESNGTLYRSLEHSTIDQHGFFINVSTCGRDINHYFYDVWKYAKGVEDGTIIDTSYFANVFTTPDNADLDDCKVWHLANPTLGTNITEEEFRRDWERHKQAGVADVIYFKRYRFNMWVQGDESYIDPQKFDECVHPMTDEELKEFPLAVGVDLAQTTDMCSAGLVFTLPDNKYYCRTQSWVCREGATRRDKSNLPKYQQFEIEGNLEITGGNSNNYEHIRDYLLSLKDQFNLKEIIFDNYNANMITQQLMRQGIKVSRMPQNHKYFNDPLKQFLVAVNEKRILHDGKKLLKYALTNAKLDVDSYGNVKLCKEKSKDKIDPAIAIIQGFYRATDISVAGCQPSVYETRGIQFW